MCSLISSTKRLEWPLGRLRISRYKGKLRRGRRIYDYSHDNHQRVLTSARSASGKLPAKSGRQRAKTGNTWPRTALPFLRMRAGLGPRVSYRKRLMAPINPARAASGSTFAIPPASRCSGSGARFGTGDYPVRPSALRSTFPMSWLPRRVAAIRRRHGAVFSSSASASTLYCTAIRR